MTEATIVAVITTIGLVVVALISNRSRQHAKAAREQVENAHSTNLREELDERHGENVDRLDSINRVVAWQTTHTEQADARTRRIRRLEWVLFPTIAAGAVVIGLLNFEPRRKARK